MDSISEGLSFYAKIKAIFSIIVSMVLLGGATYYTYYTNKLKYVKASDGNVTFKTAFDGKDCSNLDDQSTCNFFAEYSDTNNVKHVNNFIVPQNKNQIVGSTSIYFQTDSPDQYNISNINPIYISYFILVVVFLIFIGSIIHYYLISTNKGYAAVKSAIGVANNFMPRHNYGYNYQPNYRPNFNYRRHR